MVRQSKVCDLVPSSGRKTRQITRTTSSCRVVGLNPITLFCWVSFKDTRHIEGNPWLTTSC